MANTKSRRRMATWTVVATIVAAVLQTTIPGGIIPASVINGVVSSQSATPQDN